MFIRNSVSRRRKTILHGLFCFALTVAVIWNCPNHGQQQDKHGSFENQLRTNSLQERKLLFRKQNPIQSQDIEDNDLLRSFSEQKRDEAEYKTKAPEPWLKSIESSGRTPYHLTYREHPWTQVPSDNMTVKDRTARFLNSTAYDRKDIIISGNRVHEPWMKSVQISGNLSGNTTKFEQGPWQAAASPPPLPPKEMTWSNFITHTGRYGIMVGKEFNQKGPWMQYTIVGGGSLANRTTYREGPWLNGVPINTSLERYDAEFLHAPTGKYRRYIWLNGTRIQEPWMKTVRRSYGTQMNTTTHTQGSWTKSAPPIRLHRRFHQPTADVLIL